MPHAKSCRCWSGQHGPNHARLYRTIEGCAWSASLTESAGCRAGWGQGKTFRTTPTSLRCSMNRSPIWSRSPCHWPALRDRRARDRSGCARADGKAITGTVEQGEALLELARHKGVTLAVGHIERFNPAVMELRRRLSDGMAGRIYQIAASGSAPIPAV